VLHAALELLIAGQYVFEHTSNLPRFSTTSIILLFFNAIDKIRMMEDLYDAADEIGSQLDKVLQGFEASVQEILFTQGWTKTDVAVYVVSGLLLQIVQQLLSMYYGMYLHFQCLVSQNPDPLYFRDYTMLHIQHHA
jgi:hypothetical protein